MNNKRLEPWHYSWLMAHPHRSHKWLADMLSQGFDIHHIDGDKENNSPSNLVLIECTDHMMLHGSTANRLRIVPSKGKRRKKPKKKLQITAAEYREWELSRSRNRPPGAKSDESWCSAAHLVWLAEEEFIRKSLID